MGKMFFLPKWNLLEPFGLADEIARTWSQKWLYMLSQIQFGHKLRHLKIIKYDANFYKFLSLTFAWISLREITVRETSKSFSFSVFSFWIEIISSWTFTNLSTIDKLWFKGIMASAHIFASNLKKYFDSEKYKTDLLSYKHVPNRGIYFVLWFRHHQGLQRSCSV